jgi:hypothetical protein
MLGQKELAKEEKLKVKPEIHIIAVDHTHYWDPAIVKKFGRIATVYLVNMTERTYLCSMTPAVWAEFLFNVPTGLSDGEWDESDYDEWADLEYENGDEPGTYYNVGSSFLFDDGGKELELSDEEWADMLKEWDWDLEGAKESVMEGFREYIQGNEPKAVMGIISALQKVGQA